MLLKSGSKYWPAQDGAEFMYNHHIHHFDDRISYDSNLITNMLVLCWYGMRYIVACLAIALTPSLLSHCSLLFAGCEYVFNMKLARAADINIWARFFAQLSNRSYNVIYGLREVLIILLFDIYGLFGYGWPGSRGFIFESKQLPMAALNIGSRLSISI